MKKILFLSLIFTSLLIGCTSENVEEPLYSSGLNPISTYIYKTTNSVTEITTAVEQSTYESTALYTKPTETTEVIPEDGQLIRILDYIPDAEIDLRYATTNNFTGTIIYDDPEAYLCYGTVKKLIMVQNELKEMGYRILIWMHIVLLKHNGNYGKHIQIQLLSLILIMVLQAIAVATQ